MQQDEDRQLNKAEYIQMNSDLFYRRGSIQWRIRRLEQKNRCDLDANARRRFDRLHTKRVELVIESLSRFDDPTSQLEAFEALHVKFDAIDPMHVDARGEARAWFDTHRFERTCDRAGRAEIVADRYADVAEKLRVMLEIGELARLDTIRLRRLRRELDEVTAEIVTLNHKLLKSYARNFTRSAGRHDAEDYEAAGQYGLMRAISTFDPDAGRFDTWAYKHIQREVLHAFRSAEYASMNHSDFERRPAILRAVNVLQARQEDSTGTPSYEDIAAESGHTVEQVKRVLDAPRVDSLSSRVGDDGETELGDLIESEETNVEASVITSMTLSAVEQYGLTVLDPRELLVLVRRFGLDDEPEQRLASIGQMLGRSREGIRQAESRALAKLRHPVVLRKVLREGRA